MRGESSEMSVGEMSVHCTVGEMSGSVKSRSVKGRSVIYHRTAEVEKSDSFEKNCCCKIYLSKVS